MTQLPRGPVCRWARITGNGDRTMLAQVGSQSLAALPDHLRKRLILGSWNTMKGIKQVLQSAIVEGIPLGRAVGLLR